jgi:hypothetical protein
MKKILFAAILLIFSLLTFSQTKKDFLKNKLYIVKSDRNYFDSALKEIMLRVWNISEIGGFISDKELKQMTTSAENSFLNAGRYNWTNNSNMNGARFTSGIYFYQGKSKQKESFLGTAIAAFYFGGMIDENYDSAVYRLELMVRNVMTEFIYDGSADSIKKIYKLSMLNKKKTLLISSKCFSNRRKDEVITKNAFASYPYKFEVASPATIAGYIKSKDKRYALAVPVVNDATRTVGIYDVETGFYLGGFERSGMFALPIREKDVDVLIDGISSK